MAIDWESIKQEYVTSYISQRQLAKKHGITAVALNNHAKPENWLQQREEYMQNKKQELESQKTKPCDIPGLLKRESNNEDNKPGSRTNFQAYALASLDLPAIDINNPLEVEQRINEYFRCCYENGIKPQKPGLAKWLNVTKRSLDDWNSGEHRKSTHQEIIQKAYTKLEEDLYDQVQSGHIQPGSGIFLLKNMFGYKDVQDIVVAPKNPLGELQDQKALEARIMATVVVDDYEVKE